MGDLGFRGFVPDSLLRTFDILYGTNIENPRPYLCTHRHAGAMGGTHLRAVSSTDE